jgi:vanillate O-demethylase monooxygenase subunit
MAVSAFAPFVRNAWYIAAWSEDLGGEIVARTIMNEPVVLFRTAAGQATALEDRCCHRGAPLSRGAMVPDGIRCGYHGLVFDGNGKCVVIPGQDSIPSKARVRRYPVVERQGFVWIWMGAPDRADESLIVDYPYLEQVEQWPNRKGLVGIDANYVLLADNLMDPTHLGFVHAKTVGGDPDTHVNADMTVTPTPAGVVLERWMLDTKPPKTYADAMGFKGNIDRWVRYEFVAPGTVTQLSGATDAGKGARENPDQPGMHRRYFHFATPEAERSFHYFFATASGYRRDDPAAAQHLFDEIYATLLEDKAILEEQQRRLERDPARELVAIQSDRGVMAARKALARLVDAEREQAMRAAE